MKNKKKLAFLTLAMTMGMVLGACNPAEAPSSNKASSGSADTSSVVESSSTSSSSSSETSTSTPSTSATSSSASSSSSSSSSSKPVVTLVSISVTAPTKVAYTTRDTALDLAGMVVKAKYSDNSEQVVTEGYTVSQVDFSTVGEKTVTVTYQGKTATFKVTVANQKFTVKFVVNGATVQTGEVEDGQKATYNGEEPTKAADANAVKYRFKGWDKDLNQPITEDTTFTAVFAEYAASQVIDNFEAYESNADMADAWTVQKYDGNSSSWVGTNAAVSVGSKATEGSKALRFDGWENNTGFRFLKHNEVGAFSKSANAVKFNMQIPSINTVKLILKGKATIAGQVKEPSFTYEFHPTTSEYVEYVIPLAASEWQLWGEAGKTIQTAADMIGVHVDDITNYITDVGFFVQGNDGIGGQKYFAFVDNLQFVTLDEPVAASNVETMGQYAKYTGLLNDGHTVKVELGANGAATATIIDMETPVQIPGNVAIDAEKNMTFTSADSGASLVYKAQLKNGGQTMKYVEASGAMAQGVVGVDLNAVQTVDNYEQYTADGQAYYQSKPADQRSGCRGAYYSEYYAGGNNSAPWGGNGWSLLGGDGSQLKLKSDNGGHNGSKNYLCLKHSKSVAFRYMQWGLFDGTAEQNNFRGSKFSFWAKTNGYVKQFKVYMYSQSKPQLSTMTEQVKVGEFNQTEAIGQWKHFEIDLNPALTYYGFMIGIEKNTDLTANEAYLYIDDVEVYTANPYATYVPPEPPVTYGELKNGQVFFANLLGYAGATITVKKDNKVKFDFPMMNTSFDGTYLQNEDEIDFDFGMYGTMKCKINAKSDTLEYVSGTELVDTFGTPTFNEMDVLDNAETYTESGKMYYQGNKDVNNRSGARGAYICDYYTGDANNSSPIGGSKWNLMGGSGDQLSLETTEVHSGTQSLKLKRNYGATMRYATWGLMDGTAEYEVVKVIKEWMHRL